MMPKLWVLSLGILLIALLNAQLMQATPQHHFHVGHQQDGWGYAQPQRPDRHHHHHLNGHGLDHGPGSDNGFRGGSYGDRQFGGGYDGPSGPGFGGHRPGGRFGVQPGYERQQPGPGYGGFRTGPGYGAEPDAGFIDQPRPGYGGGGRHFQSPPRQQPDESEQGGYPIQPRPQAGGRDAPGQEATGFQQPGNGLFQPRPEQGTTDSTAFNNPRDGQSGNPLQPRPHQGDNDAPEFNFQSSGNPGQGTQGFQQPDNGNPIQPRPHSGGRGSSGVGFQTPGNAGTPLQPRPIYELTDSNEVQQTNGGQSGNPIQPRPTDFAQSHFQEPNDAFSKPIQPLPGQNQQPVDQQAESTIKPHPSSDDTQPLKTFEYGGSKPTDDTLSHTVNDNISAIFNTKNFLSPSLSEGTEHQGSRDPKSQVEDGNPDFIGERNLFDTHQQCASGTELRGGRCRQKA